LLTACCGGGTPAPQGQDGSTTNATNDTNDTNATSATSATTVAVVPAEPPKQPLVMADGSSEEDSSQPLPVAGMHFPEDDEPLENVNCRGRCAAPYVLGITKKDRGQIEARIRYCSNTAAKRGELNNGSVAVSALINGTGRATDVKLTPTGEVSQPVLDCVQSLVASASFTSEHDVKRTAQAMGKVGR